MVVNRRGAAVRWCIGVRSHSAGVAVVLSAAVGLTACGGGDVPSTASSSSTTLAAAESGHGSSGHGASSPVPDGARHVPVAARSFAFAPAEITVEVGEPIAIVLSSEDALHDFVVDEVDAHVSSPAGETAVGGFRATEPGRYVYYCKVAGHREAGMEGTLVVKAAP